MEAKPLVVLVAPTASGKTALAIDIAKEVGGEIICADSRTIYRGMDIGTAKPTLEEQAEIPHWGINIVDPDERFTVADFQEYAKQKIDEIRERGHVPILVGGTGLYIDAVVFNFEFGPVADIERRKKLEEMSLDELYKYCNKNNVSLPENYKNKRYVIRAIEQKSINTKRRDAPIDNCIIVGITTDRETLRTRIEHRSEQLFADGMVEEAKVLGDKYGWDHESMTGNIYPLCHLYFEGKMTLEEVKEKFIVQDWRLAKRQLTWLRRNPHIWWGELTDVKQHLLSVLAPEH